MVMGLCVRILLFSAEIEEGRSAQVVKTSLVLFWGAAPLFCLYHSGSIRHYFPSPGRQLTDCVGTHHGNLTPPRISPSCPHCLCLWLGRSIITRLLTRSLRYSLPMLFYGPMDPLCTFLPSFTAEQRIRSLCCYRWSWRIFQCRFGSSFESLSPADVSRCRI